MNRVYGALGETIFDVMSGLARETGAVNLGQGFPEWDGPLDVREAAARAIVDGPNQYPPMRGTPQLRGRWPSIMDGCRASRSTGRLR